MIRGFAAKKTPPESIEPAREPIPCTRCGRPVEQWPDEDVEEIGLDPYDVAVLGCGACEVLAAHVEGIADVWRACEGADDLGVLVRDARDGLRQKRWMESDDGEPIAATW